MSGPIEQRILGSAHMNQAFSLRGIWSTLAVASPRFASREPFEIPGGNADNLPSGILQDSQQDAE
jgi:hypothetical protein